MVEGGFTAGRRFTPTRDGAFRPAVRGRHRPDPLDQSPPQTDLAFDRQNCALSLVPRATKDLFARQSGACGVLTGNEKRTYELRSGGRTGARTLVYAKGPAALMKRD
jgi:hypothetical protein